MVLSAPVWEDPANVLSVTLTFSAPLGPSYITAPLGAGECLARRTPSGNASNVEGAVGGMDKLRLFVILR